VRDVASQAIEHELPDRNDESGFLGDFDETLRGNVALRRMLPAQEGFQTRDVYLRAGYSSLFTYCRDVLALSEHEAYNRIEAARTARRFPVVLDLLAAGEVNLTTVRLLGPHLTAENHVGVLESARGKRKAEVEEIVARLSPRGEVGRPSGSCRGRPGGSLEVA
jgi:hypothetical protein